MSGTTVFLVVMKLLVILLAAIAAAVVVIFAVAVDSRVHKDHRGCLAQQASKVRQGQLVPVRF